MDDIATREEVVQQDLWQSVPLECLVCAAAVILAAGLKLFGLMP